MAHARSRHRQPQPPRARPCPSKERQMVAPAVPEPVNAPHPEPVRIWTSPDGRYRIDALEFEGAEQPTIEILVRQGRHWRPISDPDFWPCGVAMALEIYALQRRSA